MLPVRLEAIKFNYDSSSASSDALNIRKNKTTFVDVPEWTQGKTRPEDSPAAYSMADTAGHKLNIQARFQAKGIKKAEIRALSQDYPTRQGPTGCLGWLLSWLINLLLALFGDVLGNVGAQWVSFNASGDSGFVTFELKNPRLWQAGVGIHYTVWKWEYRLGRGGPWKYLDTSRHKIYILLETPHSPWQQAPYNAANDQLPWTDVLDYACAWGMGAQDRDTAAGQVTQAVNNLGPSVIEYDCPGGGSTHYAWPNFNATEFLDRLGGGLGLGKYVNCTDCATITSTFANALGCDLWQSRMFGAISFNLNEMLGIGSAVWQTACNWGAFSYHEVAWKDSCDVNDAVFDACLQVDGDSDPTGGAPHSALLPVNLTFGATGSLLYRDRLASPAGRPNCNPQPTTRQRRQVV